MFKKIFISLILILFHYLAFGNESVKIFFYVDGTLTALPKPLLKELQHTPQNEMDELMIKKLIQEGPYDNIETNQYQDTDKNTFFVVTAKISQRIHAIHLFGLTSAEQYKLKRMFEPVLGTIYDHEIIQILSNKIETSLKDSGYLNTNIVDIQISNIPNNFIDINIYINKGNPCIIEEIILPTLYLNFLKLFKLPLDIGSQCNIGEINDGLQQIQEDYWSDGYLQAVVAIDHIEYTPSKDKAIFYIKVDLGYKTILKINDHSYNIFKSDFFNPGEGGLTYSDLISLSDSELRNIIVDFYQKQGFASVHVSPAKRYRDKKKNHIVAFEVVKGPRAKINSVLFVGGPLPISQIRMQEEIELPKGAVFYLTSLVQYKEKLKKILFKYGYNDANVYDPDFYFSPDKKLVNIVMRYDKNTQYVVSDIKYNDFPKSFKNLKHKFDHILKIGDPLDVEKKDEIFEDLHKTFLQNGYLYANIETRAIFNKKSLSQPKTPVQIIYKALPGPIVMIRKIYVEGDTFHKENTIIRISGLKTGTIFTQEKLNVAQANILKHILFTSVSIDFLDPKTLEKQESQVDIVIKVRSRKGVNFALSPAYGTGTGYRANANLNINNLTPHGLRLTLDAVVRQEVQQQDFELSSSKQILGQTYTLGLTEPLFKFFALQTPIDLSLIGGYQVVAEYLLNRKITSLHIYGVWKPTILGANVQLSLALDQENYTSLSPPNSATAIFDSPKILLRDIIPKLVIDNRDDVGWPTKGFFLTSLFGFGRFGFGSNVQFNNYLFNMKVYFPIYKRLSGGLYFGINQIDNVKNKNYQTITPPANFRTYLIDDTLVSLVRGFPNTYTQTATGPLLWLHSANISENCPTQLQPIGGTQLLFLQIEGRFKINNNLGLVLFGDSGTNYFTAAQTNEINAALQALTPPISSPGSQCLIDKAALVPTPAIHGGQNPLEQYWIKTYMSTGVGLRIILGSFMTVKLDYGYPLKDPSQHQNGCVSIRSAVNSSSPPICVNRIQTSSFIFPKLRYRGAFYFGFEAKL